MQPRAPGTRWVVAVLSAAGLLTAGVACTDEGDEDAPARAGASDGGGGVLRLAVADAPELDPAATNPADPAALVVADLVHDGLTGVGADGTVVPVLAASWSADATYRTWTFRLDPAEFSDGSPVEAADVVTSLEHVASGGDASLAATRLELISGYRAFVDGQAQRITGLTTPDESTVQIALDAPMSTLPLLLSSPLYGVVDVDDLDAEEPRTTGPFTLSRASDDGLELVAREGADLQVGAVEVRAYDDADAAYDAFDDGDADWALVPPTRIVDAAEEHGDDAFRPFHAELFFGMNVANAVLARIELRQAIALALDREAIVDAVYPDVADPVATVVPEGVPGRDSSVCGAFCRPDVARARELVAAAFPDGAVPTVGLDFDDSPDQRAMAGIVQQQLAAAGIPVELRPQPFESYQRFVVSGSQQLFSFGWIGLYPSPDAYVSPLFRSTSADNVTGFRSAEADAEIDTARAADAGAGLPHWAKAEALALDAAVVIPIAQFRVQAVVSDRIEGLEHRVDGTFDLSEVRVAR